MTRNNDLGRFLGALTACMDFYVRPVTDENARLWFDLLADHSIEEVCAAFRAHMRDPQRGRFVPVPADLIGHIEATRPVPMSANEAWAIALQGRDEAATVITNNLIDHAMSACQSILDLGDRVGARMAFLAAYERAVAAGVVPVWRLSLGHDPRQRAEAVERATTMGLITAEHAVALLPPPEPTAEGMAIAGLLTGPAASADDLFAKNRERWRKLRSDFLASVAEKERQRDAARIAEAEAFETKRRQQLNALQAGAA